MKHPINFLLLCAGFLLATVSPSVAHDSAAPAKKTGVLLVSHGSRSATWRESLLALEESVRPAVQRSGTVKAVKTAFMEYTEPSIATRLKEFDAEGFTDVVIVPVFLTVSQHTFDDIPTIIGKKIDPASLEMMRLEKIERYTPRATTVLTPNLDFPDILKENILRRVRSLSRAPADEALVLIAYGDETYEKEWATLLNNVAGYVQQHTGISTYSHGWCGHVAHYDPAKTTQAIAEVLKIKKTAIVIPVLVAHDENFQIKIIGNGIARIPEYQTRVIYRPDAILPDPNIEQWVISVATQYAAGIESGAATSQSTSH